VGGGEERRWGDHWEVKGITGALIGGTFGGAFVLANADTALGATASSRNHDTGSAFAEALVRELAA
jgi:hypothetical protein